MIGTSQAVIDFGGLQSLAAAEPTEPSMLDANLVPTQQAPIVQHGAEGPDALHVPVKAPMVLPDLEGCGPISANLFVANLTQILYKYGACLEAMQPTRTGIYCYRFFHRIG